ncbi:YicC family protein [Mangrovimicrobium sediminis]|uniref:YicC family protein n=2 Tax=Mangrovimicrobium sediminis TaxID=2562682 RepID=A0A4Z0LZM1_9GAMM|nr:YicC/YloC family endoribonuclease [Haliea sp. SAOS-164]TGD72842.1 YicC family protein [Haliea sp. SAOS-164]
MTAFARESVSSGLGLLTVELRTVNHRYLDCSFKLPDELRALEPQLRDRLGQRLNRGKVDCMMRIQPLAGRGRELALNNDALDELLAAVDEVAGRIHTRKPTALEVLQFPGVCGAPEQSEESLQAAASELFATALESLVQHRQREGEKLAALVLERLELLAGQVASTREQVPELRRLQRERVMGRIAELGVDVDQGRLEQELVYLAQKADVDEELDRLDAHVGEVRRALEKGGPCGRRLDFLMQELNREANTLSSKSTSSDTTQSAVELKVLIEQMREQIQNIE